MINNVAEFTPRLTRAALEEACDSVGLDSAGAVLVRLGENAMYRLRGEPVMVPIGRSKEVAHKETLIAEWLTAHQFQTACLFGHFNQPLITKDGFSVTFWEFIREVAEPVTSADLGRILRKLHALPPPTSFQLPDFSPMPKVVERIRRLPDGLLPSEDVDFLHHRHRETADKFASLEFTLTPGPIHGDAHARNLMRSVDGIIKLIDLEDFCYGPREWDIAVEAVRHQSLEHVPIQRWRQEV